MVPPIEWHLGYRFWRRTLNPNSDPDPNLTLTLTLELTVELTLTITVFLTVTRTIFLKENKGHQNKGQQRVIFVG